MLLTTTKTWTKTVSSRGLLQYEVVKNRAGDRFIRLIQATKLSKDSSQHLTGGGTVPDHTLFKINDYDDQFLTIFGGAKLNVGKAYDPIAFSPAPAPQNNNLAGYLKAALREDHYRTLRHKSLKLMITQVDGNYVLTNKTDKEIAKLCGLPQRKVKNLRIYWKGRLTAEDIQKLKL